MDVCADIEAVEERLLPSLLPPPAPRPLLHSLEECLDGERGRRETLAGRARRCLVADPYDPDAAHLLGLLGSADDVPLLVPGALRGLHEAAVAATRLGGPLGDDVASWSACVRGGGADPALRRGPTHTPVGEVATAEVRAAWRATLRDDAFALSAVGWWSFPGPHREAADWLVLEELAARPWEQAGALARGFLYASAENEWPVPETWAAWARDDLARGVDAARPVVDRADGRDAEPYSGAKGCCFEEDSVLAREDMQALLALPRPTFPEKARRPSDAADVRERALALVTDEPSEGLFLLGFVAARDDVDLLRAHVFGAHAVAAVSALARWRSDEALDVLVAAARGPQSVAAMSALAASRTDRGWAAALASWKGRTALTQTGTVEGCEVPFVLWTGGLDAYLSPSCLADPSVRARTEAAGSRRHDSAESSWAAWEPAFAPDPAARAAVVAAAIERRGSPDLLVGISRSPWARARVAAYALEDPVRERDLAVALLPRVVAAATDEQLALARRLLADPVPGPHQQVAQQFLYRATEGSVAPAPPDVHALVADLVAGDVHTLPSELGRSREGTDAVLAALAAIPDEQRRRQVLAVVIGRLPEVRASPDVDLAPLVAWCAAPATADADRRAVARALAWHGTRAELDRCLDAAIRAAPVEDLRDWARLVEQEMRTPAAWEALADRAADAPDDVRAALRATFLRVGLTEDGRIP